MRGKGDCDFRTLQRVGITPAYAGKSISFRQSSHTHEDHPRLCGEKTGKGQVYFVNKGSPPPMRGKVTVSSSSRVMMGITPAYAGKSPTCDFCGRGTWDHPRLCGEKSDRSATCFFKSGSPPPMRGKVRGRRQQECCGGITPAYAGKRYRMEQRFPEYRDHPRLCGEKIYDGKQCKLGRGSPPPMRGKVSFTLAADIRRRITPAYAGKRPLWVADPAFCLDHPRLCGEKQPVKIG